MAFVFSPSNMNNYRTCPRKFEGQSITGEIKWKASSAKSRGTAVHNALEKAITEGIHTMPVIEGMDAAFVTQRVTDLDLLKKAGVAVHIEHELVIDAAFKKAEWWDDGALLRARADALILPDDESLTPVVLDFKTGRKWDTDAFQLRVEALLVHLIYDRPKVAYSYWYVDTGETTDGVVDFTAGLSGVADIVTLMEEMQSAIRASRFPSRRNKFCRWCDFYRTPKCTL